MTGYINIVKHFSFTTLNCQSLYCVRRILLEGHDTEIVSCGDLTVKRKTRYSSLT